MVRLRLDLVQTNPTSTGNVNLEGIIILKSERKLDTCTSDQSSSPVASLTLTLFLQTAEETVRSHESCSEDFIFNEFRHSVIYTHSAKTLSEHTKCDCVQLHSRS